MQTLYEAHNISSADFGFTEPNYRFRFLSIDPHQHGMTMLNRQILTPLICTLLLTRLPPRTIAQTEIDGKSFSGNISWYGDRFQGRRTASGETFNKCKYTSAHRTLPFYTRVLVEDPRSGNTVIVKVNDRGPFTKARVMDVSEAAGKELHLISRGIAYVDCLVLPKQKHIAAESNRLLAKTQQAQNVDQKRKNK